MSSLKMGYKFAVEDAVAADDYQVLIPIYTEFVPDIRWMIGIQDALTSYRLSDAAKCVPCHIELIGNPRNDGGRKHVLQCRLRRGRITQESLDEQRWLLQRLDEDLALTQSLWDRHPDEFEMLWTVRKLAG